VNFVFICNCEETKLAVGTPFNLVDDFVRQLILTHDFARLQIPDHKIAVFIATSNEHAVGTERYCSYTACMEDKIDGNSCWEWL